jgi:hypothetical protein
VPGLVQAAILALLGTAMLMIAIAEFSSAE